MFERGELAQELSVPRLSTAPFGDAIDRAQQIRVGGDKL
jgi:hypothetical protein